MEAVAARVVRSVASEGRLDVYNTSPASAVAALDVAAAVDCCTPAPCSKPWRWSSRTSAADCLWLLSLARFELPVVDLSVFEPQPELVCTCFPSLKLSRLSSHIETTDCFGTLGLVSAYVFQARVRRTAVSRNTEMFVMAEVLVMVVMLVMVVALVMAVVPVMAVVHMMVATAARTAMVEPGVEVGKWSLFRGPSPVSSHTGGEGCPPSPVGVCEWG